MGFGAQGRGRVLSSHTATGLGLCWVFSREEPLEASQAGLTCWQSTHCQRAPGEPG